MFSVEMMQAAHGDTLLVEYGSEENPHRILIDGGPYNRYDSLTERLLQIPEGQRSFELLVITHIDADHIDLRLPIKEIGLHEIRVQPHPDVEFQLTLDVIPA